MLPVGCVTDTMNLWMRRKVFVCLPVPSSMVMRFSLALLVILGTYLGAVLVERTFSPHIVGSGSYAEVQNSDPWEKMKQEVAVRRHLASSRNERGPGLRR
jgi:hypothetical protein